MPTILHYKGYRFFFFSREGHEPPHVHVEKAHAYAKFWLTPVSLSRTRYFRSHELTELRGIIEANVQMFLERWHEHFAGQG